MARDNPVAAGGTVVMVLTGCLIVANAVGFQTDRHPAPLFSTRDRAVEQPASDPDGWRSVEAPVVSALVLDLQKDLRRIGLYEGPLDGIEGPATERSIRHFQRLQGIMETGEPSEALLAMIALQGPIPDEPQAPIPRPKPGPAVRDTSAGSAPVLRSPPEPEITASIPTPPAVVMSPAQRRLSQIQALLSDLGYGPLVADGVMGENTSTAIRRFELDRGLPLTGDPSDAVVARLELVSGKKVN
ncbi:peptidoglycan-binding protein [Roseibium limicola]|nr:peptidoglycan-binding domain-containing protein [Roseibium limicola]